MLAASGRASRPQARPWRAGAALSWPRRYSGPGASPASRAPPSTARVSEPLAAAPRLGRERRGRACCRAVPPASSPLSARCGLARLPRRDPLRSPAQRARSRCLALRCLEAHSVSSEWRFLMLPPRVGWLRSRATWLLSMRSQRRIPACRTRRDAATRLLQTTVVLGSAPPPRRFAVSPPPPPLPLLPWRARRRQILRCRCAPQRQQQRPVRAARCCLGTLPGHLRLQLLPVAVSKLTPLAGGRHQGAAGGCRRGLPRLLREARAG
jgi:hypothetical protein